MEIREIQLKNKKITYELHIKNNKRCYLRIKEGKLVVTASPYFSRQEIEDLIYTHQEYIIKRIDSYMPKASYQDGGYIFIFNVKYTIVLRDIGIKKCKIEESILYVYHQDIQRIIETYCKNILLTYITEYIQYRQSVISTMPTITIRKMRSRWGSCFVTKNKVSFNAALIHIDNTLIDYVILHELCHFLQPNHSSKFYQEIEKYMPDYKQRIKHLKETQV